MPVTLSTTALCTLEDVKLDLGISGSDPAQDDRLTSLINDASAAVMDYARREFAASGTATRTFGLGCDESLLIFTHDDASTITSVSVDGSALGTAQYQPVPISKRHGVYQGVRVLYAPAFLNLYGGERVVSVVGDWGFPTVPEPVARATRICVADWWHRDQRGGGSTEFDTPGGYELNIPSAARWLVRPYRRMLYA